jgi:hypothetical protein
VSLRALAAALAVGAVACALAGPAAPAPRMWVGFQDDLGFRWGKSRGRLLDDASRARVTVIRTTVYWSQTALHRPAHPRNPFDPAYRTLSDLDELLRGAQRRGIQVLLTIWGTPDWANRGAGENRLPTRLSDLEDFTHALADRYSGRHAGYPFVGLYTVWNEPNLEQFLAPQFGQNGESLAPRLYARLYRAAAAGIRRGNPRARIGIGETSHAGKDNARPRKFQPSHSPGRFAELLARERPRLDFDAWAHHPYPDDVRQGPGQRGSWPNVTLRQVPRFERALARWFARPGLPLWLSEYGYETGRRAKGRVSYADQARFLREAFALARRDRQVELFVWFVLRDRLDVSWQGGLLERGGRRKPAFGVFAELARTVDARNPVLDVDAATPNPVIRVPATHLAYYSRAGSWVGVTYSIWSGGRLMLVAQPQVPLGVDGWLTVPVRLWPLPGRTYVVNLRAADRHGNAVTSTIELRGTGEGGPPAVATGTCGLPKDVFAGCFSPE